MSILHVVRCEQYKQCKQEFSFGTNTLATDFAPETWLTLFEGNPRLSEGRHFCSKACLFNWIIENHEKGTVIDDGRGGYISTQQQPQDKPACKARRFLLVDEAADITEGIRWKDDSVCLDPMKRDSAWFYDSWGSFKFAHPGSGVQWIDQEVKEPLEEERTYEHPPMIGESESGW